MSDRNGLMGRREALKNMMLGLGAGLAAVGAGHVAWASGMSSAPADLLPAGAVTLKELQKRLEKTPRRRDFKTVPMILTDPSQWDEKALNEILQYAGAPKQVWNNTDLDGPWLKLMRNSMNVQIWSFKHPNFLALSATHGTAHLALYDDFLWDKYQLAKLTKDKYQTNVFIKDVPTGQITRRISKTRMASFPPAATALRFSKNGGRSFWPATTGFGSWHCPFIKRGLILTASPTRR